MSSVRQSAINGFNEFIQTQKELLIDKEVLFSLITFNHNKFVDIVRQNLQTISELSLEEYVPYGSTALLDTIGQTIDQTGYLLFSTPQEERPQKVIVAIITDGEQNSSKEYSNDRIKQMIEHQTTKYSWQFMFLSSDLKAVDDAIKYYGINTMNTFNFVSGSAGFYGADSGYSQLSNKLYRSIYNVDLDEKDKDINKHSSDKRTTISKSQLT